MQAVRCVWWLRLLLLLLLLQPMHPSHPSKPRRGNLTLTPPGLLLQNARTPLHKAAGNGHTAVVGQLLGAGAAIDAATKVRHSPNWTPPPNWMSPP
jgi:hypothetical protein